MSSVFLQFLPKQDAHYYEDNPIVSLSCLSDRSLSISFLYLHSIDSDSFFTQNFPQRHMKLFASNIKYQALHTTCFLAEKKTFLPGFLKILESNKSDIKIVKYCSESPSTNCDKDFLVMKLTTIYFSSATTFKKKLMINHTFFNMYKMTPAVYILLKIVAAFGGMHVSPVRHSYASVTDGQTDRQMDGRTDRCTDKVIPMCYYASQATQKCTIAMFHLSKQI